MLKLGLITHPKYPWLGASVDAVNLTNDEILEVKCPVRKMNSLSKRMINAWVQTQIQLEVLNLDRAKILKV